MAKKFAKVSNVVGRYLFQCPGCECAHFVDTDPSAGINWTFNSNIEKPTLSPSIIVSYGPNENKPENRPDVCHFFIKDGFFEYCSDSTHKFSGQKVEIPDWESN